MLEKFLLLLFINPAFPDSGEQYDSGIGEVEKSWLSDKPAVKAPVLTVDKMLQDSLYNPIRPGFYTVELSHDKNTLLLIESNKVIARSNVLQVLELDQQVVVPSVKIGLVKNKAVFIIFKQDKLEVHGLLYKFEGF